MNCPVCSSIKPREPVLTFQSVPRTGQYFANGQYEVPSRDISFDLCLDCSVVSQSSKELQESINFKFDYAHVNRTTGRQLPAYAQEILKTVALHKGKSSDLVLEIGSNDGTFLDLLLKIPSIRAIGIEPSIHCAEKAKERGHFVVNDFFNSQTAVTFKASYGQASAIVCRHTLEHIEQPLEFVRSLREVIAKDGLLVLEVPDSMQIWDDLYFHELWDEHLFYFNESSLRRVLELGGFEIVEIQRHQHLDSYNLLAFARLSSSDRVDQLKPSSLAMRLKIQQASEAWENYSAWLREKLESLPGPIYAIGAGHLQQNFFSFSKSGSLITGFIDDDQAKAHRFLPVGELKPILKAQDLEQFQGKVSLVKTAFGYDGWMDRLSSAINDRRRILDPRLHRFSLMQKNKITSDLKELGYAIIPLRNQDLLSEIQNLLEMEAGEKLTSLHERRFNLQEQVQLTKKLTEVLAKNGLVHKLMQSETESFTHLLGPDIDVQTTPHLRISRPDSPSELIGWHRDTFYGNLPGEMNIWFPLYPLQPGAGLNLLPGSHVTPSKNVREFTETDDFKKSVVKGSDANKIGFVYLPKIDDTISNMKPQDTVVVRPNCGEAVIFFGCMVHRAVNHSDSTRVSIDVRIKSAQQATNTAPGYYSALHRGVLHECLVKFNDVRQE